MKEIFQYGGAVVYILSFFSILALSLVLEKFFYYLKYERGIKRVTLDKMEQLLLIEKYSEGELNCLEKNSVNKLIKFLMNEYKRLEQCDFYYLEECAREYTLKTSLKLEKKLWILSIITNLSPLLGLFGTVTGMIGAFSLIAKAGVGNPTLLAHGISKALITTASGLAVAMPCAVFLNYFHKKSEELLTIMEKSSVEFINILRRNKNEIKKIYNK